MTKARHPTTRNDALLTAAIRHRYVTNAITRVKKKKIGATTNELSICKDIASLLGVYGFRNEDYAEGQVGFDFSAE